MRAEIDWEHSDIAFTIRCDCGAAHRGTGFAVKAFRCSSCGSTSSLPSDISLVGGIAKEENIYDTAASKRDLTPHMETKSTRLISLLRDIYVAVLPHVKVTNRDWHILEQTINDAIEHDDIKNLPRPWPNPENTGDVPVGSNI